MQKTFFANIFSSEFKIKTKPEGNFKDSNHEVFLLYIEFFLHFYEIIPLRVLIKEFI